MPCHPGLGFGISWRTLISEPDEEKLLGSVDLMRDASEETKTWIPPRARALRECRCAKEVGKDIYRGSPLEDRLKTSSATSARR